MENQEYTNDSLAIILLCSNLAINSDSETIRPFTTVEWSKFAKLLFSSEIKRPSNLFNLNEEEITKALLIKEDEANRIVNLLARAGQLSFELDELNSTGIRIVTRADKNYPKVLKEKLKDKCPPIIYYCGDIKILDNKFIGVVGSRNIDFDAIDFTKKVASKIVRDNYALISGGAKGVDGISEEEVLKNNGKVVTFVADSMISRIKKKEIRNYISDRKLLLMSDKNPKTGFTVYYAMNRNKYVYGLSDLTVVISSDYNKGGTWTGAIENLKNKWAPILVRYEEGCPKGNIEIIKKGGSKFDNSCLEKSFEDCINESFKQEEACYDGDLFSLLNNDITKTEDVSLVNESKEEYKEEKAESIETFDVYEIIINTIKDVLKDGLSLEEFAKRLNVNKTQASNWLKRAIDDGIVEKKSKPVRYKSI